MPSMNKFAGYWKKLKHIKDKLVTGIGWLNDNIIKPFKPLIAAGLEAMDVKGGDQILDLTSGTLDLLQKDNPQEVVTSLEDLFLSTQKLPSERKPKGIENKSGKYKNPFAK